MSDDDECLTHFELNRQRSSYLAYINQSDFLFLLHNCIGIDAWKFSGIVKCILRLEPRLRKERSHLLFTTNAAKLELRPVYLHWQ